MLKLHTDRKRKYKMNKMLAFQGLVSVNSQIQTKTRVKGHNFSVKTTKLQDENNARKFLNNLAKSYKSSGVSDHSMDYQGKGWYRINLSRKHKNITEVNRINFNSHNDELSLVFEKIKQSKKHIKSYKKSYQLQLSTLSKDLRQKYAGLIDAAKKLMSPEPRIRFQKPGNHQVKEVIEKALMKFKILK